MLNSRETAKILRVDNRTLARWRARGFGPEYLTYGDYPNCQIRYDLNDVVAWVEAKKRPPSDYLPS